MTDGRTDVQTNGRMYGRTKSVTERTGSSISVAKCLCSLQLCYYIRDGKGG